MSSQSPLPDNGPSTRVVRRTRWGLYLPLAALGLVVAGWSSFWFVARGLVNDGLNKAIEDARARGDVWTCLDRSLSGYPFRLELRCKSITLARTASAGVVQLSTGPMLAVGQPQTPSHVIVQIDGPMLMNLADGRRIEARWDLLEASRKGSGGDLERLSLDVRKPVVSVSGPQAAVSTFSSATLEAHVRRHPARPAADKARDLFVRVTQLASGDLDALFGDTNLSDVDLQITTNQADLLANGITPTSLEAWRSAAGKLEITRLALKKGLKQIEAKGELWIDDDKRPAGRLEPSVANIDQFAGIRLRGGAMDFASALSGRAQPANPDGLKPLPAIDIRAGRVGLGPLRLPVPPLLPLY